MRPTPIALLGRTRTLERGPGNARLHRRTPLSRPTRTRYAEQPDFETARQAYRAAQDQGVPKHKLASTVGAEIGIKSGKVWEWARIFSWNA